MSLPEEPTHPCEVLKELYLDPLHMEAIAFARRLVADMFLTLLSVVAQYERALISDRTRSSLRILKERGVELGRPRKVTPVIVKQVQTMHSNPDVSVKDVCASLGISRSSYYQALKLVA
jgi:DNA invertase Pin-like site-specific DNA recombinase